MSAAPAYSPSASRPPPPPSRHPSRPAPPRCISCASNRWTCQWDLRYHECREASPSPEDGIVPAHMVRAQGREGAGPLGHGPADPDQPAPLQEDSCPQFLNPVPLVIPMNHETDVTFQGKNLDTDMTFQGKNLDTVKVRGWGAAPGTGADPCRRAWAPQGLPGGSGRAPRPEPHSANVELGCPGPASAILAQGSVCAVLGAGGRQVWACGAF